MVNSTLRVRCGRTCCVCCVLCVVCAAMASALERRVAQKAIQQVQQFADQCMQYDKRHVNKIRARDFIEVRGGVTVPYPSVAVPCSFDNSRTMSHGAHRLRFALFWFDGFFPGIHSCCPPPALPSPTPKNGASSNALTSTTTATSPSASSRTSSRPSSRSPRRSRGSVAMVRCRWTRCPGTATDRAKSWRPRTTAASR